MRRHFFLLYVLILLLVSSCATFNPQFKDDQNAETFPNDKEIEHSFYFIGDAGNAELGGSTPALEAFEQVLNQAGKNSTAIFLGDNIYEQGLPKKTEPDRTLAEHRLQVQVNSAKQYNGQAIFIPGNHDWYEGGVKGLKRQEDFIEDALGKNSFLPENGCPIVSRSISDKIELIIVDSYWYITNWDRHPTINDNCEIKTRFRFLEEFEDLIKKRRGKTTIVAIHHPMFSNGPHGGQYSFKSHMLPLPVLGTLKNIVRKTGGVSSSDLQYAMYNELKTRLVTMAQHNKKVVFVSGHEHSLQYIEEDNVKQIVSGSGSKLTPTRNVGGGIFSYSTPGHSELIVYNDGSSHVKFYSAADDEVVFETEVFGPDKKDLVTYPKGFPSEKVASIYTKEETDKSGFYRFLWGERYRDIYSTEVLAPTVDLDTLYGGLIPIRKGGGNQSKSLRLQDGNGAQYVMRALRKNAVQYLQALVFEDQYIEGQFEDTSVERLLLDVFAGAHPYAPFVVGTLSDAAQVYHTNPKLYYVPKQNALGYFNDEFGNELYMIEEHTSEGHSDKASFGYQDNLISTEDMMKRIHKDEDIVIDEESYIRARLFDMLIGDWDRHSDQWRWIEFKENGKKVYRPMPRDRDMAFSKMSDGALLGTAVNWIPAAALLRKYSEDLIDVKGVNVEPYPIDMELIQQSEKSVWDAQVKLIQQGVTDEVIENAFQFIPKEVMDENIVDIKNKLKARRSNLQAISDRYYDVLNRFAVIKGTDKDDWFEIERLDNGQTKVIAYRIKNGEKDEVFHKRIYSKSVTKEIWIYGLDDDDMFHVYGAGDKPIKMRLIGGQNNDTYNIENGKGIVYYDYQSKNNTFVTNNGRRKLREDYESNVYDYKKLKNNTNAIIPQIGFNPDTGMQIGIADIFNSFGFERNPFTSQNILSVGYFNSTKGFVVDYSGEFSNIFKDVNFVLKAHYNSPNYAVNFFGFGNESPNPEADENDGLDVDLDYNRTRIRTFSVGPNLSWRGQAGGSFIAGITYELHQVERTIGRFIATIPENDPLFDKQKYFGLDAKYEFVNKNDSTFPTLGLLAALQAGYKNNFDSDNGFGYIIPELGFNYKLGAGGNVVLATHLKAHLNFGDGFQFFQAPSIGANNGLRGYRNERFTGKSAFVQSTDLRWNLTNLRTGFMPISIGIYGGADYGRVWIENDNSEKWNNSFGGGLFVNFAGLSSGNISAFRSDEGLRVSFQLGFEF
ncbi:MAG: phosphoesterase [Flavobacteriaceae bacterium]|nr:metallophosphoesterase [Bacteroidia bacterium]NNF74442.1 phosphoesterase [Flavobacteriaceae bacterium]